MRVLSDKLFLFIGFLMGTFYTIAGTPANSGPPSPTGKPPGPPGLPIDDNTLMLLIVALLFGIYIIYKRTIKEKASI
jgi:hypothetical protein